MGKDSSRKKITISPLRSAIKSKGVATTKNTRIPSLRSSLRVSPHRSPEKTESTLKKKVLTEKDIATKVTKEIVKHSTVDQNLTYL